MQLRSGLKEGIDVTLKFRKPADALEIHDWLASDVAPLNAAWSVIWARGDQETIRLANQLLHACGELVGGATTRSPATTLASRLTRFIAGEKQTPELEQDLASAVKNVANAREQLAQHARKTLRLRQLHRVLARRDNCLRQRQEPLALPPRHPAARRQPEHRTRHAGRTPAGQMRS